MLPGFCCCRCFSREHLHDVNLLAIQWPLATQLWPIISFRACGEIGRYNYLSGELPNAVAFGP